MASTVLVFRNCCKSVRQLGLSYSTSSLIKSDVSISLADKRMHAIDDLQHLFSSSSSSVTCSRSQHSCFPSLFSFLHFRLSKGGRCSLQSWRLDPWPAMYLFHCCTSQQFDSEVVWITNDICLLCKGGFLEEIWMASAINSIKVSQSPHLFCCKSLSWSCTEAVHDCLLHSSEHYLCPIGNGWSLRWKSESCLYVLALGGLRDLFLCLLFSNNKVS
jgi:hypothetical protein